MSRPETPPLSKDRLWIESHIPHQGLMCLLDRVEHWGEQDIICRTRSHSRPDNPLRSNGPLQNSGALRRAEGLGIATAIEYAAQATAIHSALLIGEDEKLGSGFLTSVRNVQWYRSRLDDLSDELTVHASRLSGNEMTVLYAFTICAGTEKLIDGRVSIFLNSDAARPLSNKFESLPHETNKP